MKSKNQAILRQEAILKMLDTGASISVREFSETLKCSYGTIRNDLAYLEEKGMVLRTHGGAIRTDGLPVIGLQRRESTNTEAKRDIARMAFAAYVKENMTVILDSGTTNVELAKVIASSGLSLTVLTHSAPVMHILSQAPDIQLFAFGGNYNRNSDAFYDGNLRRYADTMHADIFFMGFNGLLPEQGFAHAVYFEQSTKNSYLAMSSCSIAIGDASKLTQSGLWVSGTFEEMQALVTDTRITDDLKQNLNDKGLDVLVAEYRNE